MKKKYTIVLFINAFFSIFSPFFSQEEKNDVFSALKKNIELNSTNHDKAYSLSKEYIDYAKKNDNSEELYTGYVYASYYAPFDLQISYSDSLVTLSIKTKDNRYIGLAYSSLANANLKNYNYKKAAESAIIAEDYLKNEDSKEYSLKSKIIFGKLKYTIGDYSEAKKIVTEVYQYYKWKLQTKKTQNVKQHYLYNLSLLISINAVLKNFSDNSILIKEGNSFIKLNSDIKEASYNLVLADAINDYYLGKYNSSIEKLKTTLIQKNEEFYNESFYLGMNLWKLQDYDNAKNNFDKIIEYYNQYGKTSIQFRPMFEFYVDYYDKKGDKTEQLHSINRLLSFDKKIKIEEDQLTNNITKQYDEKKLLEEKQTIQDERSKERLGFIIILLLIFIGLIAWFFYNRKQSKKSKKENIIEKENIYQLPKIESDNEFITQSIVNTEEINSFQLNGNPIPKEKKEEEIIVRPLSFDNTTNEINYKDYLPINKLTVKQILKSVSDFENKHKYLDSNTKLLTTAEQFNTNEKYLSRIIKVKTGKNFNTYINDLRFDYLDNRIKNDPDFKNKKIKDISKALGFGTPEVFATLFKERYGKTPSEFFSDKE